MQSILSTAQLRNNIRPGFAFIESVAQTMAKSWEPDFKERKTERNYEETAEIATMDAARLTPEGTSSYIGTMQDVGTKRFQIYDYTISIPVTYQLIADNLYPEMAPQYGKALMQSQLENMNIQAARVYNEATNATNPNFLGWDDQPLLSTTHPTQAGPISNVVEIDSPFQEDTLFEMLTQMWNFRAASGLRMDAVYADKLIIGTSIARQARVLLDSEMRPGTSSFEINPSNGTIMNGFKVNRYLAPNKYFIRTSYDGIWYWNRQEFKIAQQPQVNNWAIYLASITRFNFGYDNFRAALGGQSALTGNS